MCCCVKCHKGTHARYLQSPFLYYGTHKICASSEVKVCWSWTQAYLEWARHRQRGVCCAVPILMHTGSSPFPDIYGFWEADFVMDQSDNEVCTSRHVMDYTVTKNRMIKKYYMKMIKMANAFESWPRVFFFFFGHIENWRKKIKLWKTPLLTSLLVPFGSALTPSGRTCRPWSSWHFTCWPTCLSGSAREEDIVRIAH
jgi:hypothetical protein